MREPSLARFRIRVLDPVSGAEATNRLTHLHTAWYEERAFQNGIVGNATPGQFEIPLPAPSSDEYAWADEFPKLAINQRVEFYKGDVLGGDPEFTGVIRELPAKWNDYRIRGVDSVWLAQMTRTYRNEYVNDLTNAVLLGALNVETLTFADDFASGTLGNWTVNHAGWSATTDDNGITVAKVIAPYTIIGSTATDPGVPVIVTNTVLAQGGTQSYPRKWDVECQVHLTFPAGGANDQYFLLCPVMAAGSGDIGAGFGLHMRWSNGRWEVDAFYLHANGGGASNFRTLAPTIAVVENGATDFRAHIQLICTQPSVGVGATVVMYVNGVQASTQQPPGFPNPGPSGSIAMGLYYQGTANDVNYSCTVTNVCVITRQLGFQTGATFTAGAQRVSQVASETPMLDLWNMAALQEGFQIRKDAKAGLNKDQISFGALGSDLTSSVKIDMERGDIVPDSLELGVPLEAIVSSISVAGPPGSTSAGVNIWRNIPAMQKFGIVSDKLSVARVSDYRALREMARQVSLQRGLLTQAKQLKMYRWPELVGIFKLLDKIELHAPKMGVNHAPATLLVRRVAEDTPYDDLTFDQFPETDLRTLMQRTLQTVDANMAQVQGVSPTANPAGSGVGYDRAYGTPQVIPYHGGLQAIGAGGTARIRFKISLVALGLQKAWLAWRGEGTTASTVVIDGVNQTGALGGPFAAGDQGEFDITQYLAAPSGTNSGWHEVQITSTTAGTVLGPQVHIFIYGKSA